MLTFLQKENETLITHKYHVNHNNSRGNGNILNLAREIEKCAITFSLSRI